MDSLTAFLLSFIFNLLIVVLIVRFIYYPVTRNRHYVFTFIAFNTVIFFVLSLLSSVDLSIGFGFGLFAIFSVLRYRTDPIPIREMTYLFIIIALPVMNAILISNNGLTQLLIANLVIVAVLFAIEKGWGFHFETVKAIKYEKIDLIRPEKRDQLIADLQDRTGLAITRCEIGDIDFLHDTAEIKVYFDEKTSNHPESTNKFTVLISEESGDRL